jgi:hypothetical protein
VADDQFKKWLEFGENYPKMNPQDMSGLSAFKPLFDLFPANSPKHQKEEKP